MKTLMQERDVIASMDEGCLREPCAYLADEIVVHNHHEPQREKKISERGIAGGDCYGSGTRASGLRRSGCWQGCGGPMDNNAAARKVTA